METLKEVLEILMTVVIIPAIPIIVNHAVKAFNEWAVNKAVQSESETIEHYLMDITDTISAAVLCTTQTYVEALKAQGKFDEEAQKIAFEKTKVAVMTLLAEDAKEFLAQMYGDVDLWIDTKIEQIVNLQK